MIVSDEVVDVGRDSTQLTSMTKLARDAIGKDELTAFTERGYFKSDEVLQCVQEGINVPVPKPFSSSGGLEGRFVAKNFSKFDGAEITANRSRDSNDPKAEAVVQFAKRVAVARGRASDTDLITVRVTGYDDAQIMGIVQHVASNVWTNYLHAVAETDIDYPIQESIDIPLTARVAVGTADQTQNNSVTPLFGSVPFAGSRSSVCYRSVYR